MDVNYKFKLKPFNHQLEALKLGWDRREFGLFMEMGTGKSKVLIDNMGMLYLEGAINFALVIAPKGVYRNWVSKEIPEHMSDDIPYRVIRWIASPNKSQQEEMRSVKDHFEGLTIFVMNVESFSTTSLLISTIGIILWAIYYQEQSGFVSIPMIGLTWSLMVNIYLLYCIKTYKKDKKHT